MLSLEMIYDLNFILNNNVTGAVMASARVYTPSSYSLRIFTMNMTISNFESAFMILLTNTYERLLNIFFSDMTPIGNLYCNPDLNLSVLVFQFRFQLHSSLAS